VYVCGWCGVVCEGRVGVRMVYLKKNKGGVGGCLVLMDVVGVDVDDTSNEAL